VNHQGSGEAGADARRGLQRASRRGRVPLGRQGYRRADPRHWRFRGRAAKLVSVPSALAVESGGQNPFRKDTAMLHRTCIALLIALTACATTNPRPGEREDLSPRLANLQRAAQYPWTDDGHCVMREASNEWPVLAERCFHALEHDRVRFRDVTGRCAVASAPAAAAALGGIGLCLFASPAVVTGAVIVIGTVVVAVVIKEGLDAYERSASRERGKPKTQARPSGEQEPVANGEPTPRGLGRDWFPPISSDPSERPECRPIPVSHRGGNDDHNKCADRIKNNSFPGWDVLVNGKQFDALVLATRTLWEVKTDDFDIHSLRSQRFFAKVKLPEIMREKRLAEECGYNFAVGVRSAAHKAALLELERSLTVIVMDWC
jgi:hypothetical protein